MWASKHDNREVEYAGLNMCLELITNVAETDAQTSNAFFQQFFIPILQDVFFVLTDADHKAGFKSQSNLLSRMFYLVHPADGTQPKIQGPIYTDQVPPGTSNKDFLGSFVGNLLQNAFPNLQPCVKLSYTSNRHPYLHANLFTGSKSNLSLRGYSHLTIIRTDSNSIYETSSSHSRNSPETMRKCMLRRKSSRRQRRRQPSGSVSPRLAAYSSLPS
jgi:hypothetical protein